MDGSSPDSGRETTGVWKRRSLKEKALDPIFTEKRREEEGEKGMMAST